MKNFELRFNKVSICQKIVGKKKKEKSFLSQFFQVYESLL